MVNTSADDVDTMVDNQPIVLPEQGQEIREHTPPPHAPAHATRPPTLYTLAQPGTPETHPRIVLEHLGLMKQVKPLTVVPTLREAEIV
jgi:hypothetical protein